MYVLGKDRLCLSGLSYNRGDACFLGLSKKSTKELKDEGWRLGDLMPNSSVTNSRSKRRTVIITYTGWIKTWSGLIISKSIINFSELGDCTQVKPTTITHGLKSSTSNKTLLLWKVRSFY